jgi:hypothetical protein
MTMNSPDALTELFHLATSGAKDKAHAVKTAELMREVGLKCIGFNGVCVPLSFGGWESEANDHATGPKNNQLSRSV